jgi:hypothetical protein
MFKSDKLVIESRGKGAVGEKTKVHSQFRWFMQLVPSISGGVQDGRVLVLPKQGVNVRL